MEWLASRYLVQVMTGWAFKIEKDGFGKPILADKNYHISISHSKDFTAAIIGTESVGIDIQYITPRLEGIARRVMNESKFKMLHTDNRLEHLHVYWGAKEAMFKAYGKGALDFRKNILIEPFLYENTEGGDNGHAFHGEVQKDDFESDYILFYKKIDNYILVYAIEKT